MLSRRELRWALVLTLMVMALMAMATLTTGESHTWDELAELEDGDWDDTMWDGDAGAIALDGGSSFWKYRGNAVVSEGTSGAWDDAGVLEPCVVFAKGQYYLYYTGYDSSEYAIGLARSNDGKTFTKYGSSARISKGTSGSYDGTGCREPTVLFEDGIFKMWYTGINGATESIAYATSKDGLTWVKYGSNPVLSQPSSGWGSNEFGDPCVIRVDGMYYMYLSGSTSLNNKLVGIATSSDGTTWNIHSGSPIVSKAGSGQFGQQEICDVAVVRDGPLFRMYFSGRDSAGDDFEIGYGESFDGFNWDLDKKVYIGVGSTGSFDDTELNSPGAMMGGDGTIVMYYEGNDGTDYGLGAATSMPWLLRPNPPSDKLLGTGSTYDATHLQDPSVFKHPSGVYNMYYGSYGGGSYPYSISRATSTSPASGWSKYASNPVLSRGTSGAWDDDQLASPCVLFDHGLYRMWYSGYDGSEWKIGYATSTDGNAWTKYGSNPVLSGSTGEWDAAGVRDPWVLKVGSTYHMWYVGWTSTSGYYVGHATSSDGTSWTEDGANPVFSPEPSHAWEQYYISNPCVTWEGGRYVMYYSGAYTTNKQRIGLAYSLDGGNWTRDGRNPFMDWGNDTQFSDDGVSMGSVMREGGMDHVYYAGYSGSNWAIGYATFGTSRGTYTTPVLDASGTWPVAWGTLSWDADLPLGTRASFQVATNQGGTTWRFVGPDGTSGTYFTQSGQAMHWYQSGKFLRVRAYLETDNVSRFQPFLGSITVTYSARPGPSPPQLRITSPNGGEDWMKTKAYPITWEATGNLNATSVSLAYSTNNGTSWTDIATGQPDTGFYKWTVPSTETSGALVRVTVLDVDGLMAEDTSDATFAIDPPAPKSGQIHLPAEGAVLAPGPVELSWTVEDPWGLADSPLTLELTTDGGTTWTEVGRGMPFTDGIQWDVPSLTTSAVDCRMRLSVLSWLGDLSVIESGGFSIDVSAPSVDLEPFFDQVTIGSDQEVRAVASDDVAVVSVVLHVSGTEGERTYPMTAGEDGTWSVLYVPAEGDDVMWAIAWDGVHETSSTSVDLELVSASGGTGGAGSAPVSLAMELGLALLFAVVIVAAVALALVRRS